MPWNELRLQERAKKRDIAEVIRKIRILESSGGRNDSCLEHGKINGYGYRVNKFEEVCYNSHEEVMGEVEKWVTKRIEWPLPQMLCYYNQGKKLNDCDYYKKFLKL